MKPNSILIYVALMSVLLAVSAAAKKPNPTIKPPVDSSSEEQEGEKDYIDEDHLGSSEESEESDGTTAAATTTTTKRSITKKSKKTKKPPKGGLTSAPEAGTTDGPPTTPGAATTGPPAVGTTSSPRSGTTGKASSEEDTTDKEGRKRKKSWRERRKERRKRRRQRRVSITGSYNLKTDPDNDDFKDYLKEMGFKESARKSMTKNKRVMVTIKKVNKTHWNVKRTTPNKTMELTFKSGKQFVGRLSDSRKKNMTITFDEKLKNGSRVIKMEDFDATDDIKFFMTGFNITMKAKEATATLEFRRMTRTGKIIRNMIKAFKRPFEAWGRWRRNRTSGDDDDDDDDGKKKKKKKKFPFFKKWRGKDND